MERNWLIRTSSNQILGPISKAKVIELLQKGSLNLNDELCSGNGYWFYIKEKDLVDKYVHGDVPQGYNPISESKSVLSKRENPERTTSINTAPPNMGSAVSSHDNQEPMAIPSNDDLEYPDVTLVAKSLPAGFGTQKAEDDVKLPSSDDLEFPDMTIVNTSLKSQMGSIPPMSSQVEITLQVSKPGSGQPKSIQAQTQPQAHDEQIIYPDESNLEYPDLEDVKPTKSKPKTANAPLGELALEDDEEIMAAFDEAEKHEVKIEKTPPIQKNEKPEKTTRKEKSQGEERKLLHERKTKATNQAAQATTPRSMPEELKKRNDSYLWYILVFIIFLILGLFFYYYKAILNKPILE